MDVNDVFDTFLDNTEKISTLLSEYEQVIQIIYYRSCDAIIAASIFGKVFHDLHKPCILTELNDDTINTVKKRSKGINIFIGYTIDEIESIDLIGTMIALIPPIDSPAKELIINPFNYGVTDYKYLNFSTIAYFICSAFAETLNYIIQLPLVSFHTSNMMGEYDGFIKIIADDAITGGVIKIEKDLSFLGNGRYRVSESLVYSLNPFLPGITGDNTRAIELLTKSGIEDEIKGKNRSLSDLSKDEIKDLNSNLIVQLALHKGYQEEKLEFIKNKTTIINERKDSILMNTWDFAAAIKDALYRHQITTAIAVLLGNRTDHLRHLTKLFDEERKSVGVSYRLIQDNQDDIVDLSTLRYFESDYKISWYNTSEIAAMALSHGLVTPDMPFAVIAPGPADLVTIGLRASKSHNIGNITSVMSEIMDKRGFDVNISGSLLKCQLSVAKDDYESILLDLNEKFREMID